MDTYSPRATTPLGLDVAARIIESRKPIPHAGTFMLKVVTSPNQVDVGLETDPLYGQKVTLVNLDGITPDLQAKASAEFAQALQLYADGDVANAELAAQDAASNTLVFRVRPNAKWVPSQGEVVKAVVEEVIPENGPNAGKTVLRVTSISEIRPESVSARNTMSPELQKKLEALGIIKPKAAVPAGDGGATPAAPSGADAGTEPVL